MIIHYFKDLFMFAACIVTLPCSAVIHQYTSMVNPQTGHHVHLFSDMHMGSLDTTSKQVDDLSKFVKSVVRGSKEVIVEDPVSTLTALWKNSNFKTGSVCPLNWSELGYGMQNIPVHNVDFRLFAPNVREEVGKEGWSQAAHEALQYDDSHPIIKDYYTKIRNNFSKTTYVGNYNIVVSHPDHPANKVMDMRIIHRIRHNEKININHSIVMAGGSHIDGVKNILGQVGYQVQFERGISLLWLNAYWVLAYAKYVFKYSSYANWEEAGLSVANKIALDIPSATQQA